jgi:hypothetical protein
MREKVPQQAPAAAWNDPPPVFRIFAEFFVLHRINLVTDETSDVHGGILEGTDP